MSKNTLPLNNLALHIWPERKKFFPRGSVLYWQGDPVDQIYILLDGAVKISSISPDGKVYSFGIHGAGRIFGARSYLLDGEHEAVAEVLDRSAIIVVPLEEFEHALTTNQAFSSIVMKELAREASDVAGKARDLSFLDVQQRLKHSLIRLAREHGIRTETGVMIDLDITQDEIGTLVSANRTTIAACLRDLRTQGYLWKEGRRLVIITPEHMDTLDGLTMAVVDGDDLGAEVLASQALDQGIDALKALEALTAGMKEVDRAYSRGEIELPDVVLAASAMKQALPIIEANIELDHIQEAVVGTVAIGTVFGDIHDIGKTIVAMLLRTRNFRVIDLGVNVSPDQFIQAIKEFNPDIIALSALTTATSLELDPVVKKLIQAGLRDHVRLMVGGGAVSEGDARRIGADGYHATAQGAVEMAWRLCTWKDNPSTSINA
ncbi:MAG: cobalamin-dependent protein [Anaerolineales bacterium]|nr:cobalamin-dependent protein [Anaerolineales bacterium]